ncbi:RHS repeat-associated core domain-containing protein [Pseudomonas sp.]|uniref:RHS repeat-associated core domain-containing protein n=1 Tax=Pseudomonas sp. TaxID=306 RepID=UPI003917C8DE
MTSEQPCSAHQRCFGYSPYGYSVRVTQDISLIGFGGEPKDRIGLYLLGQGYRAYSPSLMRYLSPDALSPFDAGGINAFAYCKADPINFTDPSGKMPQRAVGSNRRVTWPVTDLPENFSFLYPRKKVNPRFVQQPRSILKKTGTPPIETSPEPMRKEIEIDLSALNKDQLKNLGEIVSNGLREKKLEIKTLNADDPQTQEFVALRNFGRRVKTMLFAEAKAIRNKEQDNAG